MNLCPAAPGGCWENPARGDALVAGLTHVCASGPRSQNTFSVGKGLAGCSLRGSQNTGSQTCILV